MKQNKNKVPVYYAYVASSPFNGERDAIETLNYDNLLQRMIPRDKGKIFLNFVFRKLRKCDKIMSENEKYALILNNATFGVRLDLYRKITENEIKETIKRVGVTRFAIKEIQDIAKSMGL